MNKKEFFSPRVSRGDIVICLSDIQNYPGVLGFIRCIWSPWLGTGTCAGASFTPIWEVSFVAGKILSWRLDFEVGVCIRISSPEPEMLHAFHYTQFLRLFLRGEPVSGVAARRVSLLEAEYCVPPRWCREEVGPLGGD